MNNWSFHTCKICWSYRSESEFLLFKHLSQHQRRSKTDTFVCDSNAPESYNCEHCNFETNLKVDLKDHFTVFHEGKEGTCAIDRVFKCYKCNFKTHSLLVLFKHVYSLNHVTAVDNERFKCEHCDYKARHKFSLRIHNVWRHSDPNKINWFQCGHCSYKAKLKSGLATHMRLQHNHPNDAKWYKCGQCLFKTRTKKSLDGHMATRHDVRKNWVKCEHCSIICKTKVNLKLHVLKHHTDEHNKIWFKCEHCPFKSLVKSNLKVHKIRHLSSASVGCLKCEICSVNFKSSRNLKRHCIRKHGDPSEQTISYKCVKCSLQFSQKDTLDSHVLEKHSTKEQIVQEHTTEEHVTGIEQNTTSFKCELCLLEFKLKSSLKRHVGAKHGDPTKNNIQGHAAKEGDVSVKPTTKKNLNFFKCADCPFKTKYRNNLKGHVFSKHTLGGFRKSFKEHSDLQNDQ